MANKDVRTKNMQTSLRKIIFILISLLMLFSEFQFEVFAKKNENLVTKDIILTNINNINITNDSTKNFKALEELIINKKPKAIYLEQWITLEPHNKKLLSKLKKFTKKNKIKFYLVIGKNTWFGDRGVTNGKAAFNFYEKYVDGIVLRLEPNKTNVWKDDVAIKAQILNLMMDSYATLFLEAKKRSKQFLVEYPFWFSDFNGPIKTFPQDTCEYSDKIIFLIDDLKKLEELQIKWNDVPCMYSINLTKRALNQPDDSLYEIYKKLKSKLTLYANFSGYIVDSDSFLLKLSKLE